MLSSTQSTLEPSLCHGEAQIRSQVLVMAYRDTHTVNEEIFLYLRSDTQNNIWQVRITLPDIPHKPVRRSTKTTDKNQAVLFAKRLANQLRLKHAQGLTVPLSSWDQMFQAHLQDQPAEKARWLNETYFKKYFTTERLPDVAQLTSVHIRQYFGWRVTYWQQPEHVAQLKKRMNKTARGYRGSNLQEYPSAATLRKEVAFLRRFARWLHNYRHLDVVPSIRLPKKGEPGHTHINFGDKDRGFFEAHEIETLLTTLTQILALCERHPSRRSLSIQDCPDATLFTKFPTMTIDTRPQGKLGYLRLLTWVTFLTEFGVRPQELRRLSHEHFKLDNDRRGRPYALLHIPRQIAKTKKKRTVVAHDHNKVHDALQSLALQKASMKVYQAPSDLIFASTRNPMKHVDIMTSFKKLLLKTGLYHDQEKRYRSSYSLRAWYITHALEQQVPINVVADNCGTSIKMVHEVYSNVRNWLHRDQLVSSTKSAWWDQAEAEGRGMIPMNERHMANLNAMLLDPYALLEE